MNFQITRSIAMNVHPGDGESWQPPLATCALEQYEDEVARRHGASYILHVSSSI
jgi:hypothetical protein